MPRAITRQEVIQMATSFNPLSIPGPRMAKLLPLAVVLALFTGCAQQPEEQLPSANFNGPIVQPPPAPVEPVKQPTRTITPAPKPHDRVQVTKSIPQDHKLDEALDNDIIRQARPALDKKDKVVIEKAIRNVNRTVGAMLSNEIAKRYGEEGLPDDTVRIRLKGHAGQSLGCWLAKGVTIELDAPEPVTVTGDEKELYEVFENLIDNALKYGSDGGRLEVALGPGRIGYDQSVTVTDYGPGVAVDQVPPGLSDCPVPRRSTEMQLKRFA